MTKPPSSGIAPRDAIAAFTRRVIETHDEWDSPHSFMTLHWDGTELDCRTYACIMPDIDPPDYPALMFRLAREQYEKDPGDPACAYLLQIEGFGVAEPRADASDAERAQFRADRLGRKFHQRDDAVESVMAYCADVTGRLWSAVKVRDRDGIQEDFWGPGRGPGGRMISGLLAAAYGTGMMAWGLPGPQAPLN